MAKQQIGVTVNSKARDEVLFSHKSRKCYFCFFGPRSSQFSFFSISSILKKKLLWHLYAGHIPLYSENRPRATKNGLAGQYFGHPCSRCYPAPPPNVTGRRGKFNLLNLLGFDLSSFAEHRKEPRLERLLHCILLR